MTARSAGITPGRARLTGGRTRIGSGRACLVSVRTIPVSGFGRSVRSALRRRRVTRLRAAAIRAVRSSAAVALCGKAARAAVGRTVGGGTVGGGIGRRVGRGGVCRTGGVDARRRSGGTTVGPRGRDTDVRTRPPPIVHRAARVIRRSPPPVRRAGTDAGERAAGEHARVEFPTAARQTSGHIRRTRARQTRARADDRALEHALPACVAQRRPVHQTVHAVTRCAAGTTGHRRDPGVRPDLVPVHLVLEVLADIEPLDGELLQGALNHLGEGFLDDLVDELGENEFRALRDSHSTHDRADDAE